MGQKGGWVSREEEGEESLHNTNLLSLYEFHFIMFID